MKIYDISRRLQDAPVYPGDTPAVIQRVCDMAEGSRFNSSRITAGSHLGTHADAFSHFLPDGASADEMPLENYCGRCRVLRVCVEELIRVDDLKGRFGGVERIALCTGGNAWLCEQAASYIAQCGVKLLVTDAMSVAPEDNEETVHKLLMCGGVAIVENADLSEVPEGDYLIFAFPVKLGGCDGAPVRAVLLQADAEEKAPVSEESPEESASAECAEETRSDAAAEPQADVIDGIIS